MITGASASPVRIFVAECAQEQTESTVSMTATDNVGVTSANLSWNGPGEASGGSKGMANNGKTWTAVLGPFDFSGTVTWTVTATDAAGNTSSPATGTISVTCPGVG